MPETNYELATLMSRKHSDELRALLGCRRWLRVIPRHGHPFGLAMAEGFHARNEAMFVDAMTAHRDEDARA